MSQSRFLMTALAFEQWLRFAWLDDNARIRVTPDARSEVATRFPELMPLLERLNGTTAGDGDTARRSILDLAEINMGRDALTRVLDDESFKSDVRRFHGWVQQEAGRPTCDASHFGSWWRGFLRAGDKPAAAPAAPDEAAKPAAAPREPGQPKA